MAWTVPMTFVTGAVLSAAQLNIYLRDNMNCQAPAKSTATTNVHFITTGPSAFEARPYGIAQANTSKAFPAATPTYSDLPQPGPQVTLTTGDRALAWWSCNARNSLVNAATMCSVAVTGATEIEASDLWQVSTDGLTAATALAMSQFKMFDLTPGVNTFTMKYRNNTGIGTWADRHIMVMSF